MSDPARLAWRVDWHDSVTSTMELARQAARADGPEGLVVAAREQRAGRGRAGHAWASPPGGLYASILLREPARELAPLLPLAAALAVCEATDRFAPAVDARIKWPNDVVVRRPGQGWAKIAGVLTEAGARGAALAWVVIGIGYNLATARDRLPETDPPAESLATLGASPPPPDAALQAILLALGETLEGESAAGSLAERASSRLAMRGERVRVEHVRRGAPIAGRLLRVAPTGHLVLDVDGAEEAVAPWDATGLRPA